MNIQDGWEVKVDDETGDCWIEVPPNHRFYFGDMETTDAADFHVAEVISLFPKFVAVVRLMVETRDRTGQWEKTDIALGQMRELLDTIDDLGNHKSLDSTVISHAA